MKQTQHIQRTRWTARARHLAQWVYVLTLYLTGALHWAKRSLRKKGAVVVLTFHRVLPEDADTNSLPGMVARETAFKALARYLAAEYQLVRVEDTVPGAPSGKLPLAVTFDDGWLDCRSVVLPVARQYGVPFTVFLCSGLMGTAEPFWPEALAHQRRPAKGSTGTAELERIIEDLKSKPAEIRRGLLEEFGVKPEHGDATGPDQTISWDDARAMAKSGVNFGSHTRRHEILTTVGPETVREELDSSRFGIEEALGTKCVTLAYPNGDWNPGIARTARECGYRMAFTTQRAAWTADCDPFEIPRCNIAQDDIVGPRGNFSRAMFLYTVIWKAYGAMKDTSWKRVDSEFRGKAGRAGATGDCA